MRPTFYFRLLMLISGFFSYMSFATVTNIPTAYERVAAKHGIPASIMYAVALTESGYTVNGMYNPWPWSLNVEGDARRYKNKAIALVGLRHALNNGKHVDIGMMQINSYWHHHRVRHITEFLNPFVNLHVGAQIIVEQRQRSVDWWEAVGRYHAPGNDTRSLKRAAQYRRRVQAIHKKLRRTSHD